MTRPRKPTKRRKGQSTSNDLLERIESALNNRFGIWLRGPELENLLMEAYRELLKSDSCPNAKLSGPL